MKTFNIYFTQDLQHSVYMTGVQKAVRISFTLLDIDFRIIWFSFLFFRLVGPALKSLEGIIRGCCYIQEMFGEFVGPFQPELKTPSFHKSFNVQNLYQSLINITGLEATSDAEKKVS